MTASNYLLRRIQRLALVTILALGMSPFASAGETITFFHNDVAGSPALATDTNGLIAWKETYRPYGERVIQATASTSNDLWFTGKSHDETTGLTYMGARYYDPVIGRFTGIDPAAIDFENPHGLNRFAYANNNPYKFVDPDGRLPVFVIPLIIKAIDVAFTAHDVYTAAQQGGAAGVAKVATENAVLSAVPGGKIGSKIVDAVRKADVSNRLPDDALVCRGGTCTADRFRNGRGVTVDDAGNLQNVSVNSAPGQSVEALTQGIPNNQVGVTTVGNVRAAGGNVVRSPNAGNPNHATLSGISPEEAERLFTPTIRNPNR